MHVLYGLTSWSSIADFAVMPQRNNIVYMQLSKPTKQVLINHFDKYNMHDPMKDSDQTWIFQPAWPV